MANTTLNTNINTLIFDQIGWKYLNTVKKKVNEKKFSWTGLIASLVISFLIVIGAACLLGIIYQTMI